MLPAATIATAPCCSPQNAVNMDYVWNYASGKPPYYSDALGTDFHERFPN
jgi:hypothetical protein